MGYYSGNGVVVGGGSSTRMLKNMAGWGTAFAVRQKSVVVAVKKSGVSLNTAQASQASSNLTAICGGSGTAAWCIFDAEGSKKDVSYSRISDSNLYELIETTETLNAWQSSGSFRPVN